MIFETVRSFISRLIRNATGHNTLNVRTVEIWLQRSPGVPQGDTRGISGADFEVHSGGVVIQRGRTGNDGLVALRVRGNIPSILKLVQGAAVAEYEITVDPAPFDAVNTVAGQKQRLRRLGYQIGHGGPAGNGVDGTQNMEFERSVLDFQADSGLFVDANVNANVQNQMTAQAGG